MAFHLRRLTPGDLPRLRQFWKENWGDEFVIAHGVIYHPDGLDGFVALDGDEWIGEITYHISGSDGEIVSLDSVHQGQGVGTKLITAVVEEARIQQCQRVFVITTNDNLNALGFYQKRGFELVAVHRGAVNESRKIKPSIPLIGNHGIPLRDEIELEMSLRGGA
ncbi:MAG TPA: GNAT family N-acetyltransferase [Anaerolineales bacterium]|nr:GNAT family N-acetyltransferase [Anaerolineales bacterium]